MIVLKKLKIGDRIKCTDVEPFIQAHRHNEGLLESTGNYFVVKDIDSESIYFKGFYGWIDHSELIYFDYVSEADRLIDHAVQAYKEGLVAQVILNDLITVNHKHSDDHLVIASRDVSRNFVDDAISEINRSRKECYVIETEDDVKRTLAGSKITFMNGTVVTVNRGIDSTHYDGYAISVSIKRNHEIYLTLSMLKGSTVEQFVLLNKED